MLEPNFPRAEGLEGITSRPEPQKNWLQVHRDGLKPVSILLGADLTANEYIAEAGPFFKLLNTRMLAHARTNTHTHLGSQVRELERRSTRNGGKSADQQQHMYPTK